MPHQVFISYASDDRAAADALCEALEARDIPCWIAPRDVLPSMRWGAAINQAINDSLLMVLLLSSNANRSDHIANEVQAATHSHVAVLPLRIEDVQPSDDIDLFIRGRHWMDAIVPPFDTHLERIGSTVARILTLICPNCKEQVSERAVVCPSCGTELKAAAIAPTDTDVDVAAVESALPSVAANVAAVEPEPSPEPSTGSVPPPKPPGGGGWTFEIPRMPLWGYWLSGAGGVIAVIVLAVLLVSGGDEDGGGGDGDSTGTTPGPSTVPIETPESAERIVFSSLDDDGVEQLFSMAPDGSDRVQLTSGEPGSVEPSVSWDGTQVVFIRLGDTREIYILDLESGEEELVPGPQGDNFEPAFSPDGLQLAFALETISGDSTIYVMNVDGSDPRPLTGSEFDEQDPEWSPDGNWIVFSSNRVPGNHDIYVMQADGSGDPIRLTREEGFDGEPSWSPDGTLIAFQSFRSTDDESDGRFNLWLLDPTEGTEGRSLRQLTFDPGDEYDPAWSPDNSTIAYTGRPSDPAQVYTVSVDGGDEAKLTQSSTKSVRPSWCICLTTEAD